MADPGNRERGLRAALNNPRVSEEAKQRDREILANEFGEHMEAPQSGPASRRASSGKKSSSTGPHAASTTEEPKQGSSSGSHSAQPHSSGRKARRASSGEAGSTMHEMTEGKDKGNV